MSPRFRKALAITTALILTACGVNKSSEVAALSVTIFHQQYNDSKFAEIYSNTTPIFKTDSKEADFVKFLQKERSELGTFKSTTQEGSNTNFGNVTTVQLTYKTEFEKGSAVETFTFIISGDSARLQSYRVSVHY
jgi:hypothetical protein